MRQQIRPFFPIRGLLVLLLPSFWAIWIGIDDTIHAGDKNPGSSSAMEPRLVCAWRGRGALVWGRGQLVSRFTAWYMKEETTA